MKYYCILAINENNPKDILGLCENSFDMSWGKDRVNLWQAPDKNSSYISISHKEHFNKNIKRETKEISTFRGSWKKQDKLKGRYQLIRKLLSNPEYRNYHACGRSNNEYEWHWAIHYSKFVKPPQGYKTLVCRVNSKYCPVKIDTSVREGMDKEVIKYDKYNYRNAKFELK